eukprot:267956_1
MCRFLSYLVWTLFIVYHIASSAIWISENCSSKPTPCESSINNGLVNYANETIFNIDNGTHWVLSKSIINSNISFIGNTNNNTYILLDLSNNITCNNCQLHFENIILEVTATNNGRFIINEYSILTLQNVYITSTQYNNN